MYLIDRTTEIGHESNESNYTCGGCTLIRGSMNALLNTLFLAHEVLAFSLSRLKGVACEFVTNTKESTENYDQNYK